MVEIITRYRAEDGALFDTREAAEVHERSLEPRRLAMILGDVAADDLLEAVLKPTEAGNGVIADALERAGYLVAQNRRAAGAFKRAPKSKDDAAPEASVEARSGANEDETIGELEGAEARAQEDDGRAAAV